jgi:UDP-GlcNAc:undecaprenyl-phosphate/decaprenyl-phosphate GlcNAc-1-phosphate transferase
LLDAGLSSRTALVALVGLAVTMVFIGALARRGLAPGSNLLAFGALTITYIAVIGRVRQAQQVRRAIVATLAQTSFAQRMAMVIPLHASPIRALAYEQHDNDTKRAAA